MTRAFLLDYDVLVAGGGPSGIAAAVAAARQGAKTALVQAGIQLYGGVSCPADDAVKAFLAGNLSYNPGIQCSHHEHSHHEDGHSCGEHGCGGHSCG